MIRILRPFHSTAILFGIISFIPIVACADLVSGTINPVPKSHEFKIKDSDGNTVKTVKTNSQGYFEVTLRPGVYMAKFGNCEGKIRSSNRPLLGQVINCR